MAKKSKLSFSLSTQNSDDLKYISHRLGVSRSALVDGVLSGALSDMMKVVDSLPQTPPETNDELESCVKRLRGASIQVVGARIQSLKESLDAL